MRREAVVVCSSVADSGISSWDLESGDEILPRRPNCASPRNGFVSATHQYFAASQIQRVGSVGSGEIFFWTTNKTQAERSYPVEPIIPLACTMNGIYLAGGGSSGKIYLWEVPSWNVMAAWPAHGKTVSCLKFSEDDSLLISAADDGVIYVWPLLWVIGTVEGSQYSPNNVVQSYMYRWDGHNGSITSILCSGGGSNAVVVSSSSDQTCKVWSLASGMLVYSLFLGSPVTCALLDPSQLKLYAGTADGKIVIQSMSHPQWVAFYKPTHVSFCAHSCAITALAFNASGSILVSAAEDSTVHAWNIATTGNILWEWKSKGPITNLLVAPLNQVVGYPREIDPQLNRLRIPHALLDSTKTSIIGSHMMHKDPLVFLPTSFPTNGELANEHSNSSDLLHRQITELEFESTTSALQFKKEIMKEKRARALKTCHGFQEEIESLNCLFFDMLQISVEKGP